MAFRVYELRTEKGLEHCVADSDNNIERGFGPSSNSRVWQMRSEVPIATAKEFANLYGLRKFTEESFEDAQQRGLAFRLLGPSQEALPEGSMVGYVPRPGCGHPCGDILVHPTVVRVLETDTLEKAVQIYDGLKSQTPNKARATGSSTVTPSDGQPSGRNLKRFDVQIPPGTATIYHITSPNGKETGKIFAGMHNEVLGQVYNGEFISTPGGEYIVKRANPAITLDDYRQALGKSGLTQEELDKTRANPRFNKFGVWYVTDKGDIEKANRVDIRYVGPNGNCRQGDVGHIKVCPEGYGELPTVLKVERVWDIFNQSFNFVK